MAVLYAKKSVEIKPDCHNLDTLAVAYAEYNDFVDAIKTHQKAVDLCKLHNPDLVPKMKKHLENYKHRIKVREECPGFESEREQLRKWQSGDLQ